MPALLDRMSQLRVSTDCCSAYVVGWWLKFRLPVPAPSGNLIQTDSCFNFTISYFEYKSQLY